MGHERLGVLPRTKPWAVIVQQISGFSSNEPDINHIARQTLKNVRSRLDSIKNDDGVNAVFRFLVLFSNAFKTDDPEKNIKNYGININGSPSPLSIAKALRDWIQDSKNSEEYIALAQRAAVDSLTEWNKQEATVYQENLFEILSTPYDKWHRLGTGGGFCEISRLFFAKFTEKYLNYFLERVASSTIKTVRERELFSEQIHNHIDSVSQHAFETSKITQSFAAGWFNKHTKSGKPLEKEIRGFFSYAIEKIKEELLREDIRFGK